MVAKRLLQMLLSCILLAVLLVFTAFAAQAVTLKKGQSGPLVLKLQKDLKELGYYTQSLNSKYTQQVAAAVKTFQKANSLKPVNGVAYEKTLRKLTSGKAISKDEYVEKLKNQQLKPGGSGSYVKWLQQQLKKLGYYTAALGTSYNTKTKNAVMEFQTANGLNPSGTADAQTRKVMFSDGAVTRAQYDEANYLTEVRLGDTGKQVTYLQDQLLSYKYMDEQPSGVFDDDTQSAVRFFQEANDFDITGVATREMRKCINEGEDVVDYDTFSEHVKTAECKQGDSGVKVAVLQQRLEELGYYTDSIDGKYSAAVKNAVIKFQKFNNYKVNGSFVADGVATTALRTYMNSSAALSALAVNGTDTLKQGAYNEATAARVKSLQTRLKSLYYYTGAINGTYSASVTTAVKRFQSANGLYPSGIAYSTTLKKLESNDLVDYKTYVVKKICSLAYDLLGRPYKSRASGPSAFDCSGFTRYVYNKAAGVTLRDSSKLQASDTRYAKITELEELQAGDLLCFDTSASFKRVVNHVGIYVGGGKFVHASSSNRKVIVSPLNDSSNGNFYKKRFLYARRIIG